MLFVFKGVQEGFAVKQINGFFGFLYQGKSFNPMNPGSDKYYRSSPALITKKIRYIYYTIAMEKLPFDTTSLDADDVQALEASYKAIKDNFKVGLTNDDVIKLKEFDVFSNYPKATIGGTLLINHPESGCYLTYVKINTTIQTGRGPGAAISYYRYQLWASATLRNDFGRVIIRRESFVDKILNLVHPAELHFKDDATFSSRFYVVANDKEKATQAMTSNFRAAIRNIQLDDFMIEIVNSTLIIGSNQLITPEQAVYLADFASKLSVIR
ncbi:MAG: hypothetical protein JWR38_2781 [Mucilaginibacter sp.]|nr:hypothetical protein [Mucilaginibacter sp.]